MVAPTLEGDVPGWPPLTTGDRSAASSGWHLLRIDLSAPEPRDRSILSEDERARADRYSIERPRRQFIHCRTVLRRLCGWLLQRDPSELRFETRANGKPYLADFASLQFNVSHSGQWGLIAWSWTGEVGADIETLDARLNWRGLAQRFFAPEEHAALTALPADRQFAAFYRIWTTKEAYLKATGAGLARSLGSFVVSADPDSLPRLLLVRDDPSAIMEWTATSFRPAPDVAGVALWQGKSSMPTAWSWTNGNLNNP